MIVFSFRHSKLRACRVLGVWEFGPCLGFEALGFQASVRDVNDLNSRAVDG